jgi:CheY-like chemotaxis protein
MSTQVPWVLVVDDDEDTREAMTLVLASRGYAARSAINGREALALLDDAHELPSAIVLDLNMPIMDGAEFRSLQVSDELLAPIPVLIISSERTAQAQADAMGLPFLRKPLDIARLFDALEGLCVRVLQNH